MVTLKSKVAKRLVFNLNHVDAKKQKLVLNLAANPREEGGKGGVKKHVIRAPISLQLNAYETKHGLPDYVLEVKAVQTAIARGWVHADRVVVKPAPKVSPAPEAKLEPEESLNDEAPVTKTKRGRK